MFVRNAVKIVTEHVNLLCSALYRNCNNLFEKVKGFVLFSKHIVEKPVTSSKFFHLSFKKALFSKSDKFLCCCLLSLHKHRAAFFILCVEFYPTLVASLRPFCYLISIF